MKKIIMPLFIVMMVFVLTGCKPTTYEEVSYNKIDKMIENKEDFILFIGSETCSACSAYKITVNELVKNYGIDIKYIDISKLTEGDSEKLIENFPFNSTPTTVFVKKGKEADRFVGNEKYSKVESKLKEKGYIK